MKVLYILGQDFLDIQYLEGIVWGQDEVNCNTGHQSEQQRSQSCFYLLILLQDNPSFLQDCFLPIVLRDILHHAVEYHDNVVDDQKVAIEQYGLLQYIEASARAGYAQARLNIHL